MHRLYHQNISVTAHLIVYTLGHNCQRASITLTLTSDTDSDSQHQSDARMLQVKRDVIQTASPARPHLPPKLQFYYIRLAKKFVSSICHSVEKHATLCARKHPRHF